MNLNTLCRVLRPTHTAPSNTTRITHTPNRTSLHSQNALQFNFKRYFKHSLLALSFSILAGTAAAATLSAADIAKAVSDRTYQGSMTDNAFAEYYSADGMIRGKGYSGKWRTEDDTMCFQYGDNAEKCWNVIINGPALTLVKDGKVDGSGMLVDGNPHSF